MSRRADVAGRTARSNMVHTSRAGASEEFGRASLPLSPPLRNARPSGVGQQPCENPPLRQRRKRGAQAQAIRLTKGGRNSKIHAVVDEFCRPWVFILTPGNTADCVMAEVCVSLIGGVTQLRRTKAMTPMHSALSSKPTTLRRSSPANPIARSAFVMTRKLTKAATWSSAASAASKTPDASQRATTSWREMSSPPCASSLRWRTGCDSIESKP